MYYYAKVDENNICYDVASSSTPITQDNYIEITEEQYISASILDLQWNAETQEWQTPFIYIATTDEVDYNGESSLTVKLNSIDTAIEGKADEVHTHTQSDITGLESTLNGKANTSDLHEHSNKTVLDEITADNITSWNSKSDSTHTHSQYVTTDSMNTALSGKSDNTHTHSQYVTNTAMNEAISDSAYTHPATHPATMITGLSEVATSGSYNDLDDLPVIPTVPTSLPANGGNADTVDNKHADDFATADHNHDSDYADIAHAHTQYAESTHTHAQSDVTGLASALNEKANATHTHAQSDITGLTSALSGKASTSHTHNEYALASDFVTLSDTVDGKANTSHTHTLDNISETTDKKIMTATERTKLSGVAEGANKTTVDSALSSTSTNPLQNKVVSEALDGKVDKVNGKGLSSNDYTTAEKNKLAGVEAGANAYTHPSYNTKVEGLYKVSVDNTGHVSGATAVSKSDITSLGIPAQDTVYTHPSTHPASMVSGLATVATSGSYNDLSDKPTSMTPIAHTHSQSEITGLETALAGKSETSHNHDSAYISKTLQMTSDTGDVSVSWANKNVTTEIINLASGIHTAYSPLGNTENPNALEAFRFMCHKTGTANYGWVMAYGAKGSVYTGYIDNGVWQGWKALFEANPQPLWTGGTNGGYYMTSGHTVTPTKTLSECRNGWALLWSDFDAGSQANNNDFYMSYIYKRAYTGQVWGGGEWLFDIPSASGGATPNNDVRIIKTLKIYDDKLVGTANNAVAPRNDVVLRAVYEF